MFEKNIDMSTSKEDLEAVGDRPRVMLPPLADGHHYELAKLPSGRTAVVVEEDVPENTELQRAFPDAEEPVTRTKASLRAAGYDNFGRHIAG